MERDLSLLTDLYELTMMQGYFKEKKDNTVVFDVFYRINPFGGAYSICCGIEQMVDYIKNLSFTTDDIDYLRSTGYFDEDFLAYLSNFHFSGDIYAVPEGSVILPREPIVKIVAPIIEAQLIEPAVLNIVNHQSLIATKAARIKYAAGDNAILEFGLRRAQGPDAGIYGTRATYIAGCSGTSNVLAGKMFDIPVLGTHAHSWIMSFESEYEAFKTYAEIYPGNCTLLVDTYSTLRSGVPNAIKVFNEMKANGMDMSKCGIRIDSGDLAYLTKRARTMLDEAGLTEVKISASGDLDENLISSLKDQGAQIDAWGVGTRMITADDNPSFGGVYKLAAIEENGEFTPKIKISENSAKITNPGNKSLYRVYNNEEKIVADLITLEHETYSEEDDLLLFDPIETWKQTILHKGEYTIRPMLEPVFKAGECVFKARPVKDIQEYCKKEQNTVWEESKRLLNPHIIHVDLSRPLYDMKQELLNKYGEAQLKYSRNN